MKYYFKKNVTGLLVLYDIYLAGFEDKKLWFIYPWPDESQNYSSYRSKKHKDTSKAKNRRIKEERKKQGSWKNGGRGEDAMAAAYLIQNVAGMVYRRERKT